jgi:hypothetical protein
MKNIMIRKLFLFTLILIVFLANGCIETYDMNRLSGKVQLTPSFAISAIKGDISLSDIVKSNDTVVFDQEKFVKLIFKKDSVINLKMDDLYDLNNMVSFNQSYILGDLSIDPFQVEANYSLDQIRTRLGNPYYTIFGNLDGETASFPPFPSINLGKIPFPVISNFENAVFKSGILIISITNNLAAPLKPISVKLFNSVNNSPIGDEVIINTIQAGQTQSDSISLTDQAVTNSIYAEVILSGSNGNTTANPINLDNDNIKITILGRNLKVKSGRVLLPENSLTPVSDSEIITFDPGSGIEIDELKIDTGYLSYHIQKPSSLTSSLTISLPTAFRNNSPFSEVINFGPGSVLDGMMSLNNTFIDMGTDPDQPYNKIPYSILVSSSGMVDFKSTDELKIELKLLNPVFNYVKGYFGKIVEGIEPDSLDLEIEEVLNHITGEFLISSPSIKINYSNSFAIPIQVKLEATGRRETRTVNLGLAPFIIDYPDAPSSRDITASFMVDKSNSSLPALISLPPEVIIFSGSATANPSGSGQRNNYVFSNSRFLGSLEIEVPMEFRMNNLQFTDTVDNFMQSDNGDTDNHFVAENFGLLRLDIKAKNGFPLGASLKIILYDELSQSVKSYVEATDLISPAPVNNDGKASGVAETNTKVEFTREFFSSVNKADRIIFQFTLNTTGNGSDDVKIYSDYRIDFNAALVIKPDMIFK